MTDTGRPWPTIHPVRRWGPALVVVALLAGVGGVATAKARDTVATVAKPPTQQRAKTYADDPRLPVTYADAKKAGTLARYDWGGQCDTRTGRVKVPSVYAAPCVPVWKGTKPWRDTSGKVQTANGGDTANGVTADTITIAYYVPAAADLASAFQALGVLDSPDATVAMVKEQVEMGEAIAETYGRKVELKRFQATGDGRDPAAARADAIKVASELKAFASIGGPTQTSAYQDELAKRKVLCLACGYSTPDSSYQKDAPYAWGQLASPDQLVGGVLEFGARNLFGRPARFAGDPALRTRTRVIGIVHYDQDPPVFDDLERKSSAQLRKLGYPEKINLTYLLNLDTLATQAQTIIGKLKAAGVTSVVFLGDPLMPKYLTEQATKQNYFPEWVITGTVFTDSTAAARLYDQKQWAHAFGASSLAARTRPEIQEPQRVYRWFFDKAPTAPKSLPVLAPVLQQFFLGVHLAGPHLEAATFAGGLFRYPPSGGGPTNPRISFGFHGLFDQADYTAVDDITSVWWDATARGPDEQGKEGVGMWRYALGGKRFVLSKVPKLPDTGLFNKAGAITLYDATPPGDATATYPAWPGSPAA